MRKLFSTAALAALVISAAAATSANAATTLNFDITNIDVTVTPGSGFCLGCSVSATPTSTTIPITFSLGAGQSNTFQFVDFDLHGLGVGSATIDATLTFDSPISGSVGSSGDADYFKIIVPFVGFISGGSLTWNPVYPNNPITTADGSTFSVSFQDLEGIQVGKHVADYVTITADSVAVPEPATWALMIGGFGMAGGMLRRRRAVAVAA
jgi:hypothetical protein